MLSKQQRTGDGTNWFYPVQIKWQVRMIPRDAGKQHPARRFLQKGAEVVSCCIALEVAKRAEFKGILGSPRTGLCPATPAAAPGTGACEVVGSWGDPGEILGGDRASRSSSPVATVLAQGPLATGHPVH